MTQLKTIGMLGGMSWESTALYYRLINQQIRAQCGDLHSAQMLLRSVNFADIAQLQREGDWQAMSEILVHEACVLEQAGADCLVLCTNTMHKLAPEITAALTIPFLHIADATARALQQDDISTVGLLGTQFTMQQDFYTGHLSKYGITTLVPEEASQATVHNIIFAELCQGIVKPESQRAYLDIMTHLQHAGAEAVVLGCTEISLLVTHKDTAIRLYDTTEIHAAAAAKYALGL